MYFIDCFGLCLFGGFVLLVGLRVAGFVLDMLVWVVVLYMWWI